MRPAVPLSPGEVRLLNLVLPCTLGYTPVPVNTKTGVIYFILVTRIHTFCDTPHPHPHEIITN